MGKYSFYSRRKRIAAVLAAVSALGLLVLLMVWEVLGEADYDRLQGEFLTPAFIVLGILGAGLCYHLGHKEQQALFSRFMEPFQPISHTPKPSGGRRRTARTVPGSPDADS